MVGKAVGAQVGDDILDNLGLAVYGGTGFSGALGAGTYTFWFQEAAGPTTYSFDFHLLGEQPSAAAPLPATSLLLLAGLGALVVTKRRRAA